MRKSLNCFQSGSKVNRQFSMSFAFELTSGQWGRRTENRTSAFCEFQQHLFRDMFPNPLRTVIFQRRPLLLRNLDQRMTSVLVQIFSRTEIRVERFPEILVHCLSFHKKCRSTSTWTEFFLWIFPWFLLICSVDLWLYRRGATYRILGRCSTRIQSALHRFRQNLLSCNVLNPWKISHNKSISSPSILSKFLYFEDFNHPNLYSHASLGSGFCKIFPRHNSESEKT